MTPGTKSGLPLKRLGRTGLMVTALSMGGAGIGSTELPEREGIGAVQHALNSGINYVDTSPLYGDSERRVGLALSGIPRESYILSTKTGTHPERRQDYSWDGTLWSVENSLRLLQTDYLDLVLVHDPQDIEPVFAPRGALEVLESLKAQGVVRNIGLGQRRHEWHRRAIDSGRFDAILTYNDYHPLRTTARTGGLLQTAHDADVGVLNGSPLAFGLISGARRLARGETREGDMAQRLRDWCDAYGLSVIAVALQFSLRQPLIDATLTGAKTVTEVEENLRAATVPLPEGIWDELSTLNLTEGQE